MGVFLDLLPLQYRERAYRMLWLERLIFTLLGGLGGVVPAIRLLRYFSC